MPSQPNRKSVFVLVPPEACRPILDRPPPQPIVVDAPTHRTVRLQPVAHSDD